MTSATAATMSRMCRAKAAMWKSKNPPTQRRIRMIARASHISGAPCGKYLIPPSQRLGISDSLRNILVISRRKMSRQRTVSVRCPRVRRRGAIATMLLHASFAPFFAATLIALGPMAVAADRPSGVTALTHVRVIDGTGHAPLEDATVVIQGDHILAIQTGTGGLP